MITTVHLMELNREDLNKMRNKKSYTIRDMYKAYHKINEEVPYVRFKRILDECNKLIKDSLLNRSELIKLPCGLGYACVCKYKPKTMTSRSLSVDYKASAEYNKKIYYLNEHSNGYKYRLYWSKQPRVFPDIYKYTLNLVRANKRYLAQLIFNNNDYINIDDIQIYKM